MDRQELITLARLAGRPVSEVREDAPEVFDALAAKALDTVKKALRPELEAVSPAAWAAVRRADVAIGGDADPKDALLTAIATADLPDDVRREATDRVLAADPTLMTTFEADALLGAQPLFLGEIEAGRIHLLAEVAAVRPEAADAIASKGIGPRDALDDVLSGLVETGDVAEDEATKFGLAANLFTLVDENDALVSAIHQGGLAGREPTSLRDLIDVRAEDWRALLKSTKTRPPEGLTLTEYAGELESRVASLFPTDALLSRLPGPEAVAKAVTSGDASRLRTLGNAYPGLELQEVFADDRLTAEQKINRATKRIEAVGQVRNRNPDTELLALDLSDDSPDLGMLDGLPNADRRRVLKTLQGQQRVYSLWDDVNVVQKLLETGFHSAIDVTRVPFDEFMRSTGIEARVAAKIRAEGDVALAEIITVLGGMADLGAKLAVDNTGSDVADYLRGLPGYEELFGSQAFCDCAHCQSILSPAAYFVDLMTFVKEHVLGPHFTGRETHALHLRVRRPDLWTTPLTCANTTGTVPTLDLINEILENAIAQAAGFTGSRLDRVAVATSVYKQTLSEAVESLREPFTLPLSRIQAYLGHFERARVDVARVVGAARDVTVAATLGMAKRDFTLATTPDPALATLRRVFGLQLQASGAANDIDPLDVQELVRAAGLDRDELGGLVSARFVTGATTITIAAEKRDPAMSVQNDVERLRGLTTAALDRLHRFTRVRRHLPWTVAELDLVLGHVRGSTLSAAELGLVAAVRALQRRLGTTVEETCALTGALPRVRVGDAAPLFDRLFNSEPFRAQDGDYPKPGSKFVHPAFRTTPPAAADPTSHRLQAGLGVDDAVLVRLVTELAGALGANLTSNNEQQRGFNLSIANLSLLYRHARLVEALDFRGADRVGNLFRLIRATPGLVSGYVANADDLAALVDFRAWWAASGYSLDDLAVIARGQPADARNYADPDEVVARILGEIRADDSLTFADTILAFLEGVTEDDSRKLIAANGTRIAPATAGRLRLAPSFDLGTPLTVPAGVDVQEPDARELLAAYHPANVLPARLSGALALPVDAVRELLALLAIDLSSGDIPAALHGDDPPDALVDLVEDLVPLRVLFRSAAFDADALAFVRSHPALFGVANPRSLGIDAVGAASVYTRFAGLPADSEFTAEPPRYSPGDLRAVLAAFDPTTKFAAANPAQLARIFGVEPGFATSLAAAISLPTTATAALERLREAVELTRLLGVGGETLALVASEAYDDLHAAADALLAALRARYPQDQWPAKIDPLEDAVRSDKRDALADHLLHSTFPQFATRGDLYEYFLIDVELEGCARTSRVVAAISSVQLYVERILMNLEHDRRNPSDPNRVRVPPGAIDAAEWEWRKNYRVWEANRKVFLWPENYLEPALRDDKSPLFEELEATLLQQTIDEQHVVDVYASYLEGFDELSRLRVAGSFHVKDKTNKRDILHLVGVTSSEPPTFYYRAVENAHYGPSTPRRGTVWKPWRKLDVQITGRRADPVVVDGRLHLFWVEYVAKPKNVVANGTSSFAGYNHRMQLSFTTLRLDGRWSAPQNVILSGAPFRAGEGVIEDPLDLLKRPRWDPAGRAHSEPREGYGLGGYRFERVYPVAVGSDVEIFDFSSARGTAGISSLAVDLFSRTISPRPRLKTRRARPQLIPWVKPVGSQQKAVYWHSAFMVMDYDVASIYLEPPRFSLNATWDPMFRIAASDVVDVVNNSTADCFISHGRDLLYVQSGVLPGAKLLVRRATTMLGPTLARTLFARGIDGLLALDTQRLPEPPAPLDIVGEVTSAIAPGIDFAGAFGAYYKELFFHIPFLIAAHENAEGDFAAAQDWYHRIFDPTAAEDIPANATAAVRAQLERDRVWQYLEFRGWDVPKLREVLTNQEAIDAYTKDPFNPHAIARLRLSAYQKAVVMRYVDNLIDWGDALFTRFTTESVNEATMLYATAAAILGERPPAIGSCGEGGVSPRTYEKIAPLVESGSDFLVELETWTIGKRPAKIARKVASRKAGGRFAVAGTLVAAATESGRPDAETARFHDWNQPRIQSWAKAVASNKPKVKASTNQRKAGGFAKGFSRQLTPVFCIPRNPELLDLWNRVENRLTSIRTCRDITGARRELALFAPEIDPRLLVRARAAGLSLDEVLDAAGGDLPPYRFAYVIDRAKAFAGTVQAFGGALLGALERKDVEELTRLRSVQQRNMLELTTQVRRAEIEAAEDAVAAATRQCDAAVYRRDYLQGLATENLSPTEHQQSDARNAASGLQITVGTMRTMAGIVHLIPQLGSPFAMKFGGDELGHSLNSFANVLSDMAHVFEASAAAAGLQATFERRLEGWQHQAELASRDADVLSRQLAAADVRLRIARKSLELHERTIEQIEEIHAFYEGKFTGFALYTTVAATLQRVYRDAYNSAFAMARLAEQAYRFERGDTNAQLLSGSYWEAGRAGLLAGERLLVDLQNMERRFLETNYRSLEIDQAFSLTEVDPSTLVRLRETGTCDFTIPEPFFDLFYPGHYRRRIRSVRLTVPCVTGPYTNISATLALLGSKLRKDPDPSATALADVPLRRSVSIATSTAQQDAGVYEVNFRDERYMPFEGAGAVGSSWRLTLPSNFRPFDYRTITDVILHVAYTAESDETLRQRVEANNSALEGALRRYLKNTGLSRVYTLRHDFSPVFQRLLHHPPGTEVQLKIGPEHLPLVLRGIPLRVSSAKLAIAPAPKQALGTLAVTVDGQQLASFAPDSELGGLPASDVSASLTASPLGNHTIAIVDPGDLEVDNPVPGDTSAIDEAKIEDVLIAIDYQLA